MDQSDFSSLLLPFQPIDSSPVLDAADHYSHFGFPFPPSTSTSLPPFCPLSPATTHASHSTTSSLVGDIFIPYNQFKFRRGLCPIPESTTLFSEQPPPPSSPLLYPNHRFSASCRNSQDLDHFLSLLPDSTTLPKRLSTPAAGQSIQALSLSSFHLGRDKFTDQVVNGHKSRSRTTEDIPSTFKTLNQQASRSTSALHTFDFGFDSLEDSPSIQQETASTNENDSDLDEMGLMRSLTTRVKRSVEGDEHSGLMRGLTLSRKRPETPLEHIQSIKIKGRPTISLPTQLLSTTNTASYHAPSIQDMRVLSKQQAAGLATSPLSKTDNNDRPVSPSGSQRSNASSEPSLTDASSVSSRSFEDESVSPTDTGRNATDYFAAKSVVDTPATSCEATPCSTPERKSTGLTLVESSADAPAIPQRAPSHSKREHVRLARHRSVRSSLHAASLKLESMNKEVFSSSMGPMLPASVILARPFSAELAQLNEAVEEFASMAAIKDEEAELATTSAEEDDAYLSRKGLAKCTVEDYLRDVQPIVIAFAEAIEA